MKRTNSPDRDVKRADVKRITSKWEKEWTSIASHNGIFHDAFRCVVENASVSRPRTTISDVVFIYCRVVAENIVERGCTLNHGARSTREREREGERWRGAMARNVYVPWWTLCKSRRIKRHPEASPTGSVKLARGEAMTWFAIYYVWATSKYGALAPLPKSARSTRCSDSTRFPRGIKKNGSKSCKNENDTRVVSGSEENNRREGKREREREGQTRRAANTREIRTAAKSREAKFPTVFAAAMVE